jgi:glycosyltransferase involved in cell wall biosynthesis
MLENNIRITIGIPIYNGEKFIATKLENILSQTFQDFEIIIYDNSNDSTPDICKKYVIKDKRIQYIHEQKRSGWIQGWLNLMKKAKHDFFILASVDDLWTTNFLEENIKELDENPSAVASIGVLEFFGKTNGEKLNTTRNLRNKLFSHSFQPKFEAKGLYEEKATKILRNTWYRHHNGVIRSDALLKSLIKEDMFLWDWPIVLNLIKFGDLHISEKSKYRIYDGETTSRQGIFGLFKSQKIRLNEYIFPASTFTFWCIKNIGLRFFVKNIDYFYWLNFIHGTGILSGLLHKIRT